ncbi:MAG: recombinase family protein [Solirubrobacterales bacterium]
MTRAGIYVRISRDREGTEIGVERQEADCRVLAEARGWQVVEVFSDNDVSATNRRKVRHGYRAMVGAVEAGRLDAVVAYSSSRFYRRVRELDELIELLNDRQVEVATVVSGRIDLSTADGRMTARMLAVIDQGEAERIGERSSRAKADLKKQGRWLGGGGLAYGYDRVKNDSGRVVEHRIEPIAAGVLREVATRALAGESLNKLSKELNARGVTTPRGGRWQPSRLRQLITSPFHAGRFPDGTAGNWPAIFSEDEATLLRARFASTPTGQGRPGVAYALSGLLVCSECDRKLMGSGGDYRCMPRNGGCGRIRIKAAPVDEYVDGRLWARYEVNESEGPTAPAVDTTVLVNAVQASEARAAELHEAYAAGDLTLADFKAMREAVARRQEQAEQALRAVAPQPEAELRFDPAFYGSGELPADEVDFRARWKRHELSPEEVAELNDMFRRWISRVVVSPALRVGRPPAGMDDTPRRVNIVWKAV